MIISKIRFPENGEMLCITDEPFELGEMEEEDVVRYTYTVKYSNGGKYVEIYDAEDGIFRKGEYQNSHIDGITYEAERKNHELVSVAYGNCNVALYDGYFALWAE